MGRLLRTFVPIAAALVCTAVPLAGQEAAAPTVDALVAKNLAAKGGADKLKAIDSSRITCTATLQGRPTTMTILAKRPNLARQEITVDGQTLVIAYDGSHAWMINPSTGADPVQLPDSAAAGIRDQAQFDSPLLGYASGDTKVTFAGTETIDGHQTYHLKVTPKGSGTRDYFVDADSGLERRVDTTATQNGMSGTLSFSMSDYRNVDGVMMPFALAQTFNGQPTATLEIQKIELNVPLDDSLFRLGDKK
jgi:outer membrane lipoprotein-sorting protein